MPEHPAIIAGWERDAASYRAARAYRSVLGIPYGAHARQTIDVFHPDGDGEGRALIVVIHGGYWRTFDISQFSHWARGANERGYAVALPDYRLCPEVRVADIITDIRAAALLLHHRFRRPMIAVGHSAGGHLAAAAVATDWRAHDAGVRPNLLRHAISLSGLFDLAPLIETTVNLQLRLDRQAAEAVSPAFWPVPDDVIFEARVGGLESSEYLRQSRLIADRWSAAGATTRFKSVADANHFTIPAPLADPDSELVSALVELAKVAAEA